MPGYRTHDTIAVIAAPVLTAGTFALLTIHNHEPATSAAQGAAILTTTHLLCSYFMSPDLDIQSAIAARWGPFAVLRQYTGILTMIGILACAYYYY